MMGLDFMVTSDLQLQFIEVNNYPLWPRGARVMDSMLTQMGVSDYQIIIIIAIVLPCNCTFASIYLVFVRL